MNKAGSLLLLFTLVYTALSAQNSDTSLISLANFKLYKGTYSWRDTDQFHNMTNWDSKPYKEGHLRQLSGSSWIFRMNYRLLFPNSYDAKYKKGYPILIMFHGAGERGNCWETNCYCDGCDPNKPEPGKAASAYLNNDHMLVHGGQPFMDAVNLAGAKKADDSGLHARGFPGFVLFPQMENSWGSAESSNSAVSYALRILRILVKEHNINPDRIYIAGLSMGGQAVLKALTMADWLFAAAIAMSPVPFTKGFGYENASGIPLWIFQGGKDQNPRPAQTEEFMRLFRESGGTVKYTYYEDAGHNTWSRAFREPEFFSWLLNRRKSDIFTPFNMDFICATSDDGLQLILPAGFPAYQWEVDGSVIKDATANIYVARAPGKYRARFSRSSSSPSENDWNDWSRELAVRQYSPPAPELFQKGTTFLPDLNGHNEAYLYASEGAHYYYWEKNNREISLPDSNLAFIDKRNGKGAYTVRVADFSQCKSAPSLPKHLFFDNQAPVNNNMRPTSFTSEVMSSSGVYLSWNDPSGLEYAYEVWKKNTTRNEPWEMAAFNTGGRSFLYDSMLVPGSVYDYKIRAINSTSRSDYFPGNGQNESLKVTLGSENDTPHPPQQLRAQIIDVGTILLTWEPGKDESGIEEYVITYNGKTVQTRTEVTSYTFTDLEPNALYTFSVQTKDISGNLSIPGNQVVVSTSITGLYYKHSTGAWNSLADPGIESTWQNPETTGHVPNITLQPRTQDDYFNFEFNGYLYISTPGEYTFYINSDDGSRLFLDESMIIDFDGFHGLCNGSSSSTNCPNGWGRPSERIRLDAGPHRIRIQMFEYTGSQHLYVRYKGPDTGEAGIDIPDAAWRSGTAPSRNNPATPSGLAGVADGMTAVILSWNASSGSGLSYEVYRSAGSSAPYEIVGRTTETTFHDANLVPGKEYYYRLRAISPTGNSGYSSSVSVKTKSDNEPPTTPSGLVAESGNYYKVLLKWNSSTDNVGVARYQVWANGKLIGTSKVPAFDAVNIASGELYEFYVVAIDKSGNKSGRSETVTNELFITDTEEHMQPFSVTVFPNPASWDEMTIKVTGTEGTGFFIHVRDVLDRTVVQAEIDPEQGGEGYGSIGKFLPDGLYIISVEQGGNSQQVKVIIRN
jgi:predicted esterase/fibronectin type 3 domain-containing protein